MSLDPERTANMIVCKDYWMSRRATESYRLCDKCPVQRLVIKLAALSTTNLIDLVCKIVLAQSVFVYVLSFFEYILILVPYGEYFIC